MFKRQLNRAPWAIEKLQETLLWEREEEQIKFLRKEETDRVFEEESCTFSRIDLLYNLDSHSTKCRVIHDFTGMVKGSTLSLEIFLGEDGFDSLSECVFFLEWHNMARNLMSPSTIHCRGSFICQSQQWINKEFFQFLTLETRCNKHPSP